MRPRPPAWFPTAAALAAMLAAWAQAQPVAPSAPPADAAVLRAAVDDYKRSPRLAHELYSLYDMVINSDTASIRTVLEENAPRTTAEALDSELLDLAVQRMLVETWAQREPAAALAWAIALPTSNRRSYTIQYVLTTWAASDPAAALAAIAPSGLAFSYYVTVWQRAVERDTATALALLPRLPSGAHSPENLEYLVFAAARRDPAATATALDQPLLARYRPRLLPGFARLWAERNAAAALAWTRDLPDRGERTEALNIILPLLAATDPEAAFAALSLAPVGIHRDLLTTNLAAIRARGDPAAALAWLAQQFAGGSLELTQITVLLKLADADPAAAAALHGRLPAAWAHHPALVQHLGVKLGATGREEAIAWALALPDPATGANPRNVAMDAVQSTWPAGNPKAAEAFGRAAPARPIHPTFDHLQPLLERDPGAALARLEAMPPGETRDAYLRRAILNYSHWDFDDAFKSAQRLGTPFQPYGGLNLVELLPLILSYYEQHPRQPDDFRELMTSWSSADSFSFWRWLLQQPGGPERDTGWRIFVNGHRALLTPADLLMIGPLIQSSVERSRIFDQHLRQLADTDPAAAEALLGQLDLPSNFVAERVEQIAQARAAEQAAAGPRVSVP